MWKGHGIKVDVDLQASAEKRLTRSVRIFASQTAYNLMEPYVPMRTGTLRQNVDILPEGVHYKQPYAHRMYEGVNFNFNRESSKGQDLSMVTAHWDDAMMRARGDDLAKAITDEIKRRG